MPAHWLAYPSSTFATLVAVSAAKGLPVALKAFTSFSRAVGPHTEDTSASEPAHTWLCW
jgi:hypothetical protein